jgi:type IV pilus assembly protein PilX
MNNRHRLRFMAQRGQQRGAILVISLLLLLILTVLGVAMMRMTNMQERMAGNTRDLNLAFQGAEAALRAGEARFRVLPAEPDWQPAAGCTWCSQGALPIDIDSPSAFTWSNANSQEFGDTGKQEFNDLSADPRYTIEENQFVGDVLNIGSSGVIEGRLIVTVTAHSTGASGQANTVLQSTFARRF